ncbi:MAG TPA: ATP-binding cassette domain-containing protein [Candidatus Angelobacter sp.]|nr:ATP-binding cassette domain-containing protein [Candidatus Angelobacter sp.]
MRRNECPFDCSGEPDEKLWFFHCISKLNLKIEGSNCIGFLGPNGAGKTTTLKIFTDMIRASEGRAILLAYFVVSAALGLLLFERKEFT